MKQFQYVITDPIGLHARPAGMLVQAARGLGSTVTIGTAGGKSAPATRLLALMTLGVKQGDLVTVTLEGGSEEEDLRTLEAFFRENL